jgi:hypothetical protein
MLTLDTGVAYYLCGIMLVLGIVTVVGVLRRHGK